MRHVGEGKPGAVVAEEAGDPERGGGWSLAEDRLRRVETGLGVIDEEMQRGTALAGLLAPPPGGRRRVDGHVDVEQRRMDSLDDWKGLRKEARLLQRG